MTKVIGSFWLAADHNAWIEYIAEPSTELRAEALRRDEADVVLLFSTDASITDDFTVLADDRSLQPPEKQNTFKLSYFTPGDVDADKLVGELEGRLRGEGLRDLELSARDRLHRGAAGFGDRRPGRFHSLKVIHPTRPWWLIGQ